MATPTPSDFFIKRGDRLPTLARQLLWNDGTPINLTGCTVRWKMARKSDGAVVVDAAAAIVSAADGRVQYEWVAPDTDDSGHFEGEWRVTYPDGKTLTVPTTNFVGVHVQKSLA